MCEEWGGGCLVAGLFMSVYVGSTDEFSFNAVFVVAVLSS